MDDIHARIDFHLFWPGSRPGYSMVVSDNTESGGNWRMAPMAPKLHDSRPHERLKRLRLPSLGYRRRRGDMIQVFKFLTGQERVQSDSFFELAKGTTRGHNFKLKVPLAKSRSRQHVFSVRVIKDWNSLPSTVVSSESVNQFKTRLDRHWEHLKYEEGV
ncbi:hypothetical protein Bbelb_130550 [Branchiostoma belcheri]|nr:hypothetical protein Bbelb_130550 [Branchiostoma belcheri]